MAMVRDSIDVVIPVRNGAGTLLRAIASVQRQTLPPARIIVVDDGSTDDGVSVIRNTPGVEIITTEARGVSHARNVGIQASNAEYIAFLDCDDYWLPEKLRMQLEVFHTHPGVAIVNTDVVSIDMSGRVLPYLARSAPVRGAVHFRLLQLFNRCDGGSSSMMVRRHALLTVNGYDETLCYGEDTDMWLRLAHHYDFDFCPKALACIVENPRSVTRRVRDNGDVRTEILLQHLSVMEKWIGVAKLPVLFFANCCAEILVETVRARMTFADLLALLTRIEQRLPRLHAKIAPNRWRFCINLLLSGAICTYPIARRFVRYLRRRYGSRNTDNRYIIQPIQ